MALSLKTEPRVPSRSYQCDKQLIHRWAAAYHSAIELAKKLMKT